MTLNVFNKCLYSADLSVGGVFLNTAFGVLNDS